MLRIVLLRPGSTELDEQGRIKGTLDIPLSKNGEDQVARSAKELADIAIQVVYSSPCQPAMETAETVAKVAKVKVRRLPKLHNLDQGLWQGKLIEEVRQNQPKVYRKWREYPESVCPPDGETLGEAQQRVRAVIEKLLKKHKAGIIAMVVPEPLASLVHQQLNHTELGDLWEAECEHAQWDILDVQHEPVGTN